MSMKHLCKYAAIALTVVALLVFSFTGCQRSEKVEINFVENQQRMIQLLDAQQFDACTALLDSIELTKSWEPEMIYYFRGLVFADLNDKIQAEQAYRKGIEAGKENVANKSYFMACYMNLALLLREKLDYEGAIEVASEGLNLVQEWSDAGERDFDMTTALRLYGIVGQTQAKTGQIDEAEKTFDGLWEANQSWMGVLPDSMYCYFFVESQLDVVTSIYESREYSHLFKSVDRMQEVMTRFEHVIPAQTMQYYELNRLFYEIIALAETGKQKEAADLYDRFTSMEVSNYPGYSYMHVAILRRIGRSQEAAKYYTEVLEQMMSTPTGKEKNEIMAHNLATGYQIMREAQDNAKALELGDQLSDMVDSVFIKIHNDNAAELATVFDTQGKERQIAEQEASLSRQRWIGTTIAMVLLTAFFIIYAWYRRRAQKRLAAAHAQLETAHEKLEHAHSELKTAYDQLEETTTAKERIESELRIARDIQMSMVPGIFPDYEGLDMFASMTPAKEVGGDLYGYVMQGNTLYFCVGDVSGKGVPASLFMAQSARLFRTLAAEGMMPADIASRMNNELADNNDQGMFVTMFIGLLHLDTGRLDFCNCGHNAPVMDGQFLEMEFANQPIGLWEDDPFDGESIDDIRGKQLLIYTDGLNEAENQTLEQLGNDRLIELMSDVQGLDSHQIIHKLVTAVEHHRSGADPNDDLTLMCLKFD